MTDDFVELVDDLGLQPAENITPLVRTEVVGALGRRPGRQSIDGVSARLTETELRLLNGLVDDDVDIASHRPRVASAAGPGVSPDPPTTVEQPGPTGPAPLPTTVRQTGRRRRPDRHPGPATAQPGAHRAHLADRAWSWCSPG